MRTFFDSSALTKLYIEESGSEETTQAIVGATEVGLSELCIPEVISALNRNRREGRLDDERYEMVKGRFLEDVADAGVLALTRSIIDECVLLLENTPLRASDAVHVASAIDWECDLFVSGDVQQIAAAKKAGVNAHKV